MPPIRRNVSITVSTRSGDRFVIKEANSIRWDRLMGLVREKVEEFDRLLIDRENKVQTDA